MQRPAGTGAMFIEIKGVGVFESFIALTHDNSLEEREGLVNGLSY